MTSFDQKLLKDIQNAWILGRVAGRTEAIHGAWKKEPNMAGYALRDARDMLADILPFDVDNTDIAEIFHVVQKPPSFGEDKPTSRSRALQVLDLLALIGQGREYRGKESEDKRRKLMLAWAKRAGIPDDDPRMLRRIDLALVAEANFLDPDARVARIEDHIAQHHPSGSFARSLTRLSLATAMRERGTPSDYADGLKIICEEHEFRKNRYGASHPLTLVAVQHFLTHLVTFVERCASPAADEKSQDAGIYRKRVGHLRDACVGRKRLRAGLEGLEDPPSALDLVGKLRDVRAEIFGEKSRPVASALGLRARIHLALNEYTEAELIARAAIDAVKGFSGSLPDVVRARNRIIIAASAARPPEEEGEYHFSIDDLDVLDKQHESYWVQKAMDLKIPANRQPARASKWTRSE